MTSVTAHLTTHFVPSSPSFDRGDLYFPQQINLKPSQRDNEFEFSCADHASLPKEDVVNMCDSSYNPCVTPPIQTNNQLHERLTLNGNFLVSSFNQHLKSLLNYQGSNEAKNEERLFKILRPITPPPDVLTQTQTNTNLQPHSKLKPANLNAEIPPKLAVFTNTAPNFAQQDTKLTSPPTTPTLFISPSRELKKKRSQSNNHDSDEEDFSPDYDNENSIFSMPFNSACLQPYSHVRACNPRELLLDTKLVEKYRECWPDKDRILNSKMPYRDLYKDPWIENIFPLFVLLVTSRRKALVSVFRSFFDFLIIKAPASSPREIRRAINGKLKRLVFVYPHLQFYGRTGFTLKNLRSVPEILLVMQDPFLKEKFQESVGIRCYKDVKLYSTLDSQLTNFSDEQQKNQNDIVASFDHQTLLCNSWNKKGGLWGLDLDVGWRS